MKKFCNWMDSLPKLVKFICCFWILDLLWAAYRICEALIKKDAVHLVLAILWIFAAATVGWILDLVWILLKDHIFWFKA